MNENQKQNEVKQKIHLKRWIFFVVPSGENANKFNEHLELILDFMGILEHEPELWERIKEAENACVKS